MYVEFRSLSLQAYLENFMTLVSRYSQTTGIRKFLTSILFLVDLVILIALIPILIILFPFRLLYTLLIDWANGSFMSYIIFIGLLWDLAILFVYNFIVWLLYKFIYFNTLAMGKTMMEKMSGSLEKAFGKMDGTIIDEDGNLDNDIYENPYNNNLYIIDMQENEEKN